MSHILHFTMYLFDQIIISGTLGQGAFGEVFKGTIVEPIPNPRMKNLLKQSCDHFVAIKLLKC